MRVSAPVELARPAQPRAPSIPSTAEIVLSPVPQPAGAAAVPWRHVAPPQAREPQAVATGPQPPWMAPQTAQAKLDLAKPRPAVAQKPAVYLAQPTIIRFAAVYVGMPQPSHDSHPVCHPGPRVNIFVLANTRYKTCCCKMPHPAWCAIDKQPPSSAWRAIDK